MLGSIESNHQREAFATALVFGEPMSEMGREESSQLECQQSSSPSSCVTKIQLAQYLQISTGLINKLMSEHGMPHFKIGRNVRFRVPEVVSWFERKGMKV